MVNLADNRVKPGTRNIVFKMLVISGLFWFWITWTFGPGIL